MHSLQCPADNGLCQLNCLFSISRNISPTIQKTGRQSVFFLELHTINGRALSYLLQCPLLLFQTCEWQLCVHISSFPCPPLYLLTLCYVQPQSFCSSILVLTSTILSEVICSNPQFPHRFQSFEQFDTNAIIPRIPDSFHKSFP